MIRADDVHGFWKKAVSLSRSLRSLGHKDATPEKIHGRIRRLEHCPCCKRGILPEDISADHIQPRSRNGALKMSNVQFVCQRCNRAKGDLTDKEFRDLLNLMRNRPEMSKSVLRRLLASGWLYGRGK